MIDRGPARIHVLVKPAGAACNLSCEYCFFLDKAALYPGSSFRMSGEVLETYIQQLIESHRSNEVTVAWQGGEPTLMGVGFFRKAVDLLEKHRKPGMRFINTLQTNGTLIDDEWCRFFKDNDFLIGISIDGPQALHDVYRVDKAGRPTFDRVMNGLRLLQKHGVDYNVLTAVNRANGDHPIEVYRFLRDEAGAKWMQFIPVVERMDRDGTRLYQKGSAVSDRSVLPRQFGRFLSVIFDEWVRRDVGKICVQTFEATIRNWIGLASSGMCVFDTICGHGLALEHNGDVYSCDHFVDPDHLIGNIRQERLIDLVSSERQKMFGSEKSSLLPRQCRECYFLFACHGECPKNRFLTIHEGEPGLNYLCEGYLEFFRHIERPVKIISNLIRQGMPASHIMALLKNEDRSYRNARKNDPCPCGSGIKFKRCHGSTGRSR